mmetsp:Transcript_8212/g.23604  ORF Transcript_8212/g.23604 Transcript_8212/m.23604 type:complete len:535 (-) Transcript_8212:698-2302(-)
MSSSTANMTKPAAAADMAAASLLAQFKVMAAKEATATITTASTEQRDAVCNVSNLPPSTLLKVPVLKKPSIPNVPLPQHNGLVGNVPSKTPAEAAGVAAAAPAPISQFIQRHNQQRQQQQQRQNRLHAQAQVPAITAFRRSRTVSMDNTPFEAVATNNGQHNMVQAKKAAPRMVPAPLAQSPTLRPLSALGLPQPLTPLSVGMPIRSVAGAAAPFSTVSPMVTGAAAVGALPPLLVLEHHDWRSHSRVGSESSSVTSASLTSSEDRGRMHPGSGRPNGKGDDNIDDAATSDDDDSRSFSSSNHSSTSTSSSSSDDSESDDGSVDLEAESERIQRVDRKRRHLFRPNKHSVVSASNKRQRTASFRSGGGSNDRRDGATSAPSSSTSRGFLTPTNAASKPSSTATKKPAAPAVSRRPKHSFVGESTNASMIRSVLRKGFSWRQFPELEEFLRTNRDEYFTYSSLNYTMEQRRYNNDLTKNLLKLANDVGYVFEGFTFANVRDRIRCYYKSYVQAIKKRTQQQQQAQASGAADSHTA